MHHPSVPAALRIPGFAIPVLGNFAPVFEDERPEVSSDVRLGLGMMLRRLLDTCRRQATWKAKGGRGQNAGWVRMLRLTYCVMGLTKEVVIMVSVLAKPVWGCYGERVGNRLCPHHNIRVWRGRWASAVSQTRIPAPWAEFSPCPGPSWREDLADPVTGMFVEVMAISPTVRTRARLTLNGRQPGRSPGRSEIAQRRSSTAATTAARTRGPYKIPAILLRGRLTEKFP